MVWSGRGTSLRWRGNLILLLAWAGPVHGAQEPTKDARTRDAPPPAATTGSRTPPVLSAARLDDTRPRLDGVLDDDAWARAPVAAGFTQFEPEPGSSATQRTEARVLYGDDALWVAIRAFDTAPDSIAAQLTRRDQPSYSDEVAVVVDSYFDRRTAFHFQVNPLGVKTDIYRFDDTGEDRGWDAVWDVATVRDADGWSAEFRIPYSQLRFRDAPDQTWGINFMRRLARADETSVWAPTSRNESAIVSRFGELRGLRELAPPRRLEVTPYTLARLERSPGDLDNPFYRPNDFFGSAGADLKYGVTSDLTLDVTLNPDFGQVEADPAQVNLTAYEVFLPEQRPFFVEGANFFSFGIGFGDGGGQQESLFYTRRVGRAPQGAADARGGWADRGENTTILGALKLSGKTAGGWSVGLLNAVTAEEHARIAPAEGADFDQAIEPLSNYSVARIQKDFREGRSALGVIGTAVNRDRSIAAELGLRSSAFTVGVDGRHRFADERWEVSGYVLGSHARGSEAAITALQRAPARLFQRPDAEHVELDPTRTSLSGVAATAAVNKIAGGHWRLGAGVEARSPGFDVNDAGFMRDADYASGFLYVGYDQSAPQGIFRRWRVNSSVWTALDWTGQRVANGGNLNANGQFTNFWHAYAGVNAQGRGLSTGALRGGPALVREAQLNYWAGFGSDSRRAVGVDFNGFGNVTPAEGSWSVGVSPNLRWRPSGRATVALGGMLNRTVNDRQWVGRFGTVEAPAYVVGRIEQTTVGLTGRMDLAVSPTLSLQLYAQPFVSAGGYDDFKRVADPRARSYDERFASLDLAPGDGDWVGDLDGDGAVEALRSPDFNVRQFRSNAVIRWEYRPGSVLFVVWAQGRDAYAPHGVFDFAGDFDALFGDRPSNVFMIKASYWLTP